MVRKVEVGIVGDVVWVSYVGSYVIEVFGEIKNLKCNMILWGYVFL